MVEANSSSDSTRNIIDAHVHVWTDAFGKYPLAKGFQPQDMEPKTFIPQDILSRAQPCGVGRIVLIQMSYYGFDNSYMLDVMDQWPNVFAGVAAVDWNASHPEAEMRRLARLGVRGFRIFPEGCPAQSCLDGDGIDSMFRCAAEEGFAICLLINPDALGAAQRRCERFPETTVVIDHLARIGMAAPIRSSEVQSLCSLARLPHVKVKVSAFYALGEKKLPHSDLIPLIRQVYESFGEQRLMWGTDCPFQLTSETYQDSLSVIQNTLSFLTLEAKEWILGRTAEATFFS
ncbi:MAG TPA: amidohydrolase family protein [Terriglobia bacterium]|nr:amidohydrolase family protein [Terriglobia bacterium]